jgi:hypothetical protein
MSKVALQPSPLHERQEVAETSYRKISMNLSMSDFIALRNWAAEEGTSVSGIIRRALMVLRFLSSEQERGSTIVVRTPPDELDQILRPLRQMSGLTTEARG